MLSSFFIYFPLLSNIVVTFNTDVVITLSCLRPCKNYTATIFMYIVFYSRLIRQIYIFGIYKFQIIYRIYVFFQDLQFFVICRFKLQDGQIALILPLDISQFFVISARTPQNDSKLFLSLWCLLSNLWRSNVTLGFLIKTWLKDTKFRRNLPEGL